MKEGDKVICISEKLPQWKTTGEDKGDIGTNPGSHPKINEILTVDEILGDFLRFDRYDTDSYNWWKSDRFRKLSLQELMEEEENTINVYEDLINDLKNK
jgi:hypothetical protein